MIEGIFEGFEKNELTQIEAVEYQKISPEHEISVDDAKDYMDEHFKNFGIEDNEIENPHEEIIDGKIYYFDDNGSLYRIENDLMPDSEYEINGYKYSTDEIGRIASAEGILHLKNREGRLPIKDSIEDIGKGDQLESDDRGHVIGDQFDGSNGLENMVPQDAGINRNDFKNFENELASSVRNGDVVSVNIEPLYVGDSRRPTDIVVTYSINEVEDMRIFPNREEL